MRFKIGGVNTEKLYSFYPTTHCKVDLELCTMLKGGTQPELSPPTNVIAESFFCYQDEFFSINLRNI